MGRPKRDEQRSASPKDRAVILNLKGTTEYAVWLDEAFKQTHIPKTTMFRLAMKDWAAAHDLPAPPEF